MSVLSKKMRDQRICNSEMLDERISAEQWAACIDVLQRVSEDTTLVDDNDRFKSLVAKIYRSARHKRRQHNKQQQQTHDRHLLELTKRCQQEYIDEENNQYFVTQSALALTESLKKARTCYICKQSYRQVNQRYHQLCPVCAEQNECKREQRCDLTDRIFLLTGGRIKIGYELLLKLLRDGAFVIATTRFPRDGIRRLSQEYDYETFKDRVVYQSLDLRHLPSVEAFVDYLHQHYPYLDAIINNAAQTIRRPSNFYAELYQKEQIPLKPNQKRLLGINNYSSMQQPKLLEYVDETYFPSGRYDIFGQALDKRNHNSWRETLADVSTIEFIETQVINAFAPFILNSRLKTLLLESPHQQRFIINVSAMEGQFSRKNKTHRHPHTNMAKAAMNMMTRTAAQDFARSQIYMNSVDTGWVTQENPYPIKDTARKAGFVPPLDVVDGAARIYDPIVQAINGHIFYGHFLKDYKPHPW